MPVYTKRAHPAGIPTRDHFHHSREGIIQRRGNTKVSPLDTNKPVEGVNFRWPPRLPVVVHGRMNISNLLGPPYHVIGHILGEGNLQPRGHRHHFPHNPWNQVQHVRVIQRRGHTIIDDDGQRIKHAVPTHLFPFRPPNIIRDRAGNAGLPKQFHNLLHPRARIPHQLANGHLASGIMINHPGLGDS